MLELLRNRRSVRRFTTDPVADADRTVLEEALLRAPSSRGLNPWEFVFVDDPELLARLARCKAHGAGFVASAPLAVVVCGDETRADTWIEDASIASILLQLAAQSRGLGSCWVQVRLRSRADETSAESFVQDLLGIPAQLRVESIIAVGHPAEHKAGHDSATLQREKLHRNRF